MIQLMNPLVFFKILTSRNVDSKETDKMHIEMKAIDDAFASHYTRQIQPHLLSFEEKRIKALEKSRKRLWLSIPVIIFIVLLVAWITKVNPDYVLFDMPFWLHAYISGIVIIAVTLIWAIYPAETYLDRFKSVIFPKIFSYFGKDFVFNPTGEIPVNSLLPSAIIPEKSFTSRQEDYVKGTYKGVTLELVEASVVVKKELTVGPTKGVTIGPFTIGPVIVGDDDRTPKVVFKGILVLLSLHKKFSGKTIVLTDKGRIGNLFTGRFKQRNLENVKLEDPVFEKQFEVYSTSQVEARYLLTVTFMERLLKLANIHNGKIECSFYDDRLLIMIETKKDYFESGPIHESVEQTIIRDINMVRKEMGIIFQIVDILKLDQKTGL